MNKFLNKKVLIAIIILIPVILIIIGIYIRTIQPNNYDSEETIQQDLEHEPELTDESKKITIDDIKEDFMEENKEHHDFEIINDATFQGSDGLYALVEYRYFKSDNFFRLYSMDTGEYWTMPTMGIIEIDEIISENEICFVNRTGKCSDTNKIGFPHIIRCVRDNKENQFESIKEDLFLDIETPFRFGANKSDISDIKIYTDSIEILFDVKFVAGYVTIPPADISYDKDEEQMIIIFDRCNTEFDIDTLSDTEVNPFIRTIDLENVDNKCILKIGLKSTKKYNMKEKVIRGEFPEPANVLLTITFKG